MRTHDWLRPLGGILAAVVLFELILRHLYFGLPVWRPGVGWGYYDTTLTRRLFEGGSTSHWDRRGIRVVPGPLPSGKALLVVGNSITQASQVEDDEAYTALLQHSVSVPVLNAGRDAKTLASDVLVAPHLLGSLQPAWTIVQLVPLDLENPPPQGGEAQFTWSEGNLVAVPPDPPFGPLAGLRPLRERVALINVGLMRLTVLRDAPAPPLFRAADRTMNNTPRREAPVELELDALREAYQGRVTMFLVPDFLPPATSEEQRFEAWCRKNNASCVNLRSVFDDFRSRGRAPTGFANSAFGQGHLNRDGHAAAAKLLAAEIGRLRQRGLF